MPSALDDRGNPIHALRPQDVRRAADADDHTRAHLANHLKEAIRVESQRFTAYRVGWVLASFFAWIFLQVVVYYLDLRQIPGVRFAAFFGGAIVLGIIGRELTRQRISRLVAATAVAEGICGQCCYSLGGVPTDPDSRITCPECGAAWAEDRITRPHWAGASLPSTFHEEKLPWRANFVRSFRRFITSTPKPASLIAADDRGRFVRTVDSRFLLVPRTRRDELTSPRLAALKKATRRKGRILRFFCCLPLAAAGAVAIVGAVDLLDDHEAGGAAVVACVGLFFFIVAIAMNFGHAFLPPAHTARVLVADRLCGSCTASLVDVPVDSRGLTTCPACGSSWQTSPQTQP